MRHVQRRRLRPPPLLLLAALGAAPRGPAIPEAPRGADPPPVAAAPAREAPGWRWLLAEEPVPAAGGLLALATGPDGAAAAGDARGLLVRVGDEGWQRIPLRGPVRDLAYAPDGALWVASDEGLFRFAGDRLAAHPPAPGDAARAALRVAVRPGALAVATQDGVHWSRDGRRFARVEGAFGGSAGAEEEDPEAAIADDPDAGPDPDAEPAQDRGAAPAGARPPVHGLALGPPVDAGSVATLWIAAERGLFRARLASRDGAARVRAAPVETPAGLRPALDVALADDGVLVLGPGLLLAGDREGRRWRAHRPELPPGALPLRLLATPRGLWLATDRGVVEADRPDGSWRRAGEPAGSEPTVALAAEGERLWAAGVRGLLVGGPEEGAAEAAPAAWAPPASSAAPTSAGPASPGAMTCDPPIAAVRRAALAYLDLTGAHTARMWRGVRRRGALPQVVLSGSAADDRRHFRTWDEAFVSGDTRRLFDRDRDQLREAEVALRLTWNLGDLLYHVEEIDVSTEMRRTIELRDDVLDELNQLYFDRRRARAAAALAAAGSAEAAREQLRAEELAAGLDAWTGGWFGPRAGRSPCPAGDG